MRYAERFDALDTTGGTYSAYKVPKWLSASIDMREYLYYVNEAEAASEEMIGLSTS